jgi:hypothetical protein
MINAVIVLLVGVLFILALRKIIRDAKNGGSCAGCSGCSGGSCQSCSTISAEDIDALQAKMTEERRRMESEKNI